YFWTYYTQIARTLDLIPHNSAFSDMFGAANLLQGIFESARPRTASMAEAVAVALAMTGLLLGALLWAMTKFWAASDLRAALNRLDEPRRLGLLAGALLLSGCFFAGQ